MVSSVLVPPTDNSAVDGYVVTAECCDLPEPQTLQVTGRIPAGSNLEPLPSPGIARIFTGATIPAFGAAVVMQEDCVASENAQVTIPAGIKKRQNIRSAGQDISVNQVILKQGQKLKPADIGLAASIGYDKLCVKLPLKVAIFSTGDELVEPGKPAPPGKIYNSNRYMLIALLQKLSLQVVDLGVVADTFEATLNALTEATKADLIISSGGASVGEEDHIKAALEKLGHIHLWKLAIKPGKPLVYGAVGHTPFLGLPGNPASVIGHLLRRCHEGD